MKQFVRSNLGWLIAGGLSAVAVAHVTRTSFLEVSPRREGPVSLRWELPVHDLAWSVFIDADNDGVVTPAEIAAARQTITSAALAQIELYRGGGRCEIRVADLAVASRAGDEVVGLDLGADCPDAGRLRVGGPLFMTGAAEQRVLLSATRDGVRISGVIDANTPVWDEPESPSGRATFLRFIGEGVWHVLIGYDHIAFILLLLLPSVLRAEPGGWRAVDGAGAVWRDLLVIVTAFTVAHSITLALAMTGTVTLPSKPVEVAIAASIAVAAAVNLMPRLARLRLALASGFGLVHGFGFAAVLGDLDGGGAALLPVLAGFNVGVEVAQLAIVAAVLPLIYVARRRHWYAGSVLPIGSCALGAAGLVWMLQRL